MMHYCCAICSSGTASRCEEGQANVVSAAFLLLRTSGINSHRGMLVYLLPSFQFLRYSVKHFQFKRDRIERYIFLFENLFSFTV